MKKTIMFAFLVTLFPISVLAQESMVVVDSKINSISLDSFDLKTIESVTILKDQAAFNTYGNDVKNGVIIVQSRNVTNKKEIKPEPLIIIDGEKYNSKLIVDGEKISSGETRANQSKIKTISVLKNESAIKVFGDAGKNGVVIITTK